MSNIAGEVTVKVFAEASDELKAFIRAEVRKALAEVSQEGMKPEQKAEFKKKSPFHPNSEK